MKILVILVLFVTLVGAEVAQARQSTSRQLNEILAGYMGIPGFKVYRGSANRNLMHSGYWNPKAKQLHIGKDLYQSLRSGVADKNSALSWMILAHELGHIGQPSGVPNQTGGVDVTPQFKLDMENQADAYAMHNLRKLVNLFFATPRERQLMTHWGRNQLKAYRKQHPYTLKNANIT